jgi:hypothetical protein
MELMLGSVETSELNHSPFFIHIIWILVMMLHRFLTLRAPRRIDVFNTHDLLTKAAKEASGHERGPYRILVKSPNP